MAQKFHFAILRIEVTGASRGRSSIAVLLVETQGSLSVLLLHSVSFGDRSVFSQGSLYQFKPLMMPVFVILSSYVNDNQNVAWTA